jgi:PAS domain S-box-containing protein
MDWFPARPEVVWRISVATSAVAYFGMAFAGMYFLHRRRDVRYGLFAVLFVLSLLGAGATRAILAWRADRPVAPEQEASALTNGVLSAVMAIVTLRMIPAALQLASRDDLERVNRSLRDEVQARQLAEEKLRRIMENEHRASEAKLSSYFESASQAIIAVSADGRIALVNRRTEEMFGYPAEELLGQKLELLLPERYRTSHIGHRAGYFAEPHVRAMGVGMELAGRRKDGTEFPVEIGLSFVEDESGRVAFGLVTDITERKRMTDELALANAELKSNEATLRSYLESAAQAVLAVAGDGRVALVNRRTEEMFGYTREELLGQELEILLPTRRRATHARQRVGYFAKPHIRRMDSDLELFGQRKDGTEFPADVALSYIETKKGLLSLALVSDITERKRAADHLARINAELRSSNAELEQFAYVASHDLQEPLRMITSYLHLLERRYNTQLDADAQEFIHFAVDGANRMKVLIRDLLSFSRAGTEAVKCIDVPGDAILQSALSNLRAAIDEKGAVIASDPLPAIFADPGLIARVFQNLIGNAIKFHKEGQPQIHISASLVNHQWVFSVRDNGIGIEPQHAERIFQIFQRLHSADAYPGTGIGLAISKKIIERHSGRIWLESKPGKGSTFHFSIPFAAHAPHELHETAST